MKKKSYLFLLVFAFCFFVISCANSPKQYLPSTSLELVSEKSLKNGFLGTTQNENPYMEPVSLLWGKTTEFVVIKLDYYTPSAANVSFAATIVNDKKEQVASLKSIDEMRVFWEGWEGDIVLNRQRSLTLTQTYIPDTYFASKPGEYSYYAVLAAKNPIQRPATLHAELRVDGLNPTIIDVVLPDPVGTKVLGLF